MPPKGVRLGRPDRESSIEHTAEYDDFMAKLAEYHEKRGTTLEAEPTVGSRHLNLLDLYNRVMEEGGYDLASDTKAKPLMWRKIAEEFIGKTPHLAAQAFQVKSAYYRNLAAYEITTHWKEDPPPREILEDLTAKGGNIRGRTLENFARPGQRESLRGAGGDSDSDEGTPQVSRADIDDGIGLGGRSTRGLRQAPPQRVLFQPEVQSTRQSRTTTAIPNASPSPSINVVNQLSNPQLTSTNTTLANYEPRSQLPLTLKPVTTPANNPDYFRLKRKQIDDQHVPVHVKRLKSILLPGSGFIGPNIYSRTQLALQSGIPEEERYALHHLVKISHERGDKYRFDQFPGLAELLIEKVLSISGLFYDVKWSVDYSGASSTESDDVLDGLRGTPDVMEKLKSHASLHPLDSVQSQLYFEELQPITEAALILRNMVILEENAAYVSRLPIVRDLATVVLGLDHESLTELRQYTLEIVEQLSVHLHLGPTSALYHTLLRQISGTDRGHIVTALKATARLGMKYRENKRLESVPPQVLVAVSQWLLVEDEELRSACLDFLYQFSSIADNIEALARDLDLPQLVKRLTSLLLFDSRQTSYVPPRQSQQQDKVDPENAKVPRLASGLIENLVTRDEPERSSHWLRMCFIDDPEAEMTQIDLWKSYQGTFAPFQATRPHLVAGEFIKNVSNTFSGASAQVAGQNKYVIRGIKPRSTPLDYRGRELLRCKWRVNRKDPDEVPPVFAHANDGTCGQWFPSKDSLLDHILRGHVGISPRRATPPPVDGTSAKPKSTLASFDYSAVSPESKQICCWSSCRHIPPSDIEKAPMKWALLAIHVDTHLPDGEILAAKSEKSTSAESEHYWLNTSLDEQLKDPCGLPLGAALCLRNIARGLSRLADDGEQTEQLLQIVPGIVGDEETEEIEHLLAPELVDDEPVAAAQEGDEDDESKNITTKKQLLIRRIFGPVRRELFFTLGYNKVLRDFVGDVLRHLARSGAY